MRPQSLIAFTIVSIIASLATITLKFLAYFITGSVGLLSDAFESIVNLAASVMAYFMLRVAEQPPDKDHMYGHTKAEYFSSIFEGFLILLAAVGIGITAFNRIFHPRMLEQISLGLIISTLASVINLTVGIILIKNGKKHHSITLTADGQHLLTDVWTSAGVILAVFLVSITKWQILDPLIAIFVALNIIFTGYSLIKQSVLGLMDSSVPKNEYEKIKTIIEGHCKKPVVYHDLLTRQSASQMFVTIHILTPNQWTIKKGHDLVDRIEMDLKKHIPRVVFLAHLEPIDDKKSWEDITLKEKS